MPFPLAALLSKIEQRASGAGASLPLKRLLLPVNRSLQRRAAEGRFFAYPRAVAAADMEPPLESGVSAPVLTDRLFIGYHEKAGVLEVISYNEEAGRFEFQVVRDYREGGQPSVRYANRALCTSCHQNQSPIFSRPLWEETNANPKVAALLGVQRDDFYGFPVRVGIGVSQAFDEATDRANEFAATQWLWQEACERPASPAESIECRAHLTRFFLQYLLSGRRAFDWRPPAFSERFAPSLVAVWNRRWPDGIAIPDPDIPNRDPFTLVPVSTFPGLTPLEAGSLEGGGTRLRRYGRYEPTTFREPLRWWRPPATNLEFESVLVGLARFVTQADVVRLDRVLSDRAAQVAVPSRAYEAPCLVDQTQSGAATVRLRLRCSPVDSRALPANPSNVSMAAEMGPDALAFDAEIAVRHGRVLGGWIERLTFHADDARERFLRVRVRGGLLKVSGLRRTLRLDLVDETGRIRARTAAGDAVEKLRIEWFASLRGVESRQGTAMAVVRMEGALLDSAVAAMEQATRQGQSDVFAKRPFRRVRLLTDLDHHLAAEEIERCCLEDIGFPAPLEDLEGGGHGIAGQEAGRSGAGPAHLFHRYCAACHHGEDVFPPNFLHGTPSEVEANLRHCAERIAYRLGMWTVSETKREEAPMPPATEVLRHGVLLEAWTSQRDYRALVAWVARWLRDRPGTHVQQDVLLSRDYDGLRACMPDRVSERGDGERERTGPCRASKISTVTECTRP